MTTRLKTNVAKGVLAGAMLLGASQLPVIPDNVYAINKPDGKDITYQLVTDYGSNTKETKEIGRRCYNIFQAPGKEDIVEFISCEEYQRITKIPDYPAPHKDGYTWHGRDTIKFDTPSGSLDIGYHYTETKKYRTLFEPSTAKAAIAFDATTNGGVGSAICSDSWTHTVTGTETYLVVGSGVEDSLVDDRIVDSVTYNGTSMTFIVTSDDNNDSTEFWGLVNPATGAHTVEITWCTGGFATNAGGGAASYTGVHQSSPLDTYGPGSFINDSTPSIATTTVNSGAWVIASVIQNVQNSFADLTASQTQRWEISNSSSQINVADNNAATIPAGSVTIDWTCTGSQCTSMDGVFVILSLRPATAPASAAATKKSYIIEEY